MFSAKKNKNETATKPLLNHYMKVFVSGDHTPSFIKESLKKINNNIQVCVFNIEEIKNFNASFVLSLFLEDEQLDLLSEEVWKQTEHSTTMIVVCKPEKIVGLGQWLNKKAAEKKLKNTQLIIANNVEEALKQIPKYLVNIQEDNVIYLPNATGVENAGYKNFFIFSPSMHELLFRIRSFADNGITRLCLLGGPGIGKTSLAYYYYIVRHLGEFVAVNLAAENTGDKSAIKSLLCGHVTGAFPGAGSRNGAFSQARDGVCFLDESHQISGAVMEVLMEALEGQYMPYGASAKRPMECALLYATNRSWEHLQNSVNLDEFTRMGASVIKVPELHERKEDLIAVVASLLANLGKKCKTWKAPVGLTPEAWDLLYNCKWYGNVRGLIRVLETAFVDASFKNKEENSLIKDTDILKGIKMWEPEKHHSHKIYYQEDK